MKTVLKNEKGHIYPEKFIRIIEKFNSGKLKVP
jgi:hypothetical protein